MSLADLHVSDIAFMSLTLPMFLCSYVFNFGATLYNSVNLIYSYRNDFTGLAMEALILS